MRVKWNRNLDGNASSDSGHSPPSDNRNNQDFTAMKERNSAPVRSKKNSRNACDIVFGPRRISPGALRAAKFTRNSCMSSDEKKGVAKLSNFLGLFKFTSDNGKTGRNEIPSIKTDSKRRRRANHLLQRNSAIRRSWNQMNMQTGGGGGSLGRSWLSSSPSSHHYYQSRFRPTSPSGSTSTKSWKISEDIYGDGCGGKVGGSSSPSETSQFGNSCKVNSMPAPIVTLPECVLDDEHEDEHESKLATKKDDGKHDNLVDKEDRAQDERDHGKHDDDSESIKGHKSDDPTHAQMDTKIEVTTPKSAALRDSDGTSDVFIQVRITSSSCSSLSPPASPLPTSQSPCRNLSSLAPAPVQITSSTSQSACTQATGEDQDQDQDQDQDHVKWIKESQNQLNDGDKMNVKSNFDTKVRSSTCDDHQTPTHQQTIRKELTTTTTITKSIQPPSSTSTVSCSRNVQQKPIADVDFSVDRHSGHTDSGESHHYDLPYSSSSHSSSSPSSSPARSRPKPINGVPVELYSSPKSTSNPISDENETYLYTEPQKSEIIRVTVRKAQIPEVVHLRCNDIVDIDGAANGVENLPLAGFDENDGFVIKYRHGSKQHLRAVARSGDFSVARKEGRESSPIGSAIRGTSRQGILKDSNCVNNGLNYRNSLPKKVHFAESTKVTSHSRFNGSSSTSSSLVTSSSYPVAAPGSSATIGDTSITSNSNSATCTNGGEGTTISSSSTVTIRKSSPASLSRRSLLHHQQKDCLDSEQASTSVQAAGNVSDGKKCSLDSDHYHQPSESPVYSDEISFVSATDFNSTGLEYQHHSEMFKMSLQSDSNDSRNISKSSESSQVLEHHRRISQLHQKKLDCVKEELTKSIKIVEGLSIVVKHLTEQYDAFSNPILKDRLKSISDKLERSDNQFRCQEELMSQLRNRYQQMELQLRNEVEKLRSEMGELESRNESDKMNLIASFELEMDAARRRFEEDLQKIEEVKNDLEKLNNQLRDRLKLQKNELEKNQLLNRELIETRKNIDDLKQRLKMIETAKDRQNSIVNSLRNENRCLKEDLKRDRKELSKVAMRKEELEYMLHGGYDQHLYKSETEFESCISLPGGSWNLACSAASNGVINNQPNGTSNIHHQRISHKPDQKMFTSSRSKTLTQATEESHFGDERLKTGHHNERIIYA